MGLSVLVGSEELFDALGGSGQETTRILTQSGLGKLKSQLQPGSRKHCLNTSLQDLFVFFLLLVLAEEMVAGQVLLHCFALLAFQAHLGCS